MAGMWSSSPHRRLPTILPIAGFAALALAASEAPARQPVNRIPDDQPALRRVFPPAEADRVPPGTGKFILFSREKIGGRDDWDFLAGAWEFIPSRPGAGVVKRAEFARSSWTASLAVDPSSGIEGPARNLVLHQVHDSTRPSGLRRNLLRIDFRTWEVGFLGESPFVSVEGGDADTLLARSEGGYRHFRMATGRWRDSAAFTRIAEDREGTGLWLVEGKEGPNLGTWSYQPAKLAFAHPFPRPQWDSPVDSAARDDGGAWAVVTVDSSPFAPVARDGSMPAPIPPTPPDPHDFSRPRTVDGRLWLAGTGDAEWRSWPVQFRATPGSGMPWIVREVALWFEGEALFFQAAEEKAEDTRTIHQWNVSKGRKIRRSEAESLRRREPKSREVPAEFRHWFRPDEAPSADPGLLAAAILRDKGLVEGLPTYADRHLGVSADGRRFLWKTKPSKEPRPDLPPVSALLYLDLDQGSVVEVPCPAELVRDNALRIEWVRCGDG